VSVTPTTPVQLSVPAISDQISTIRSFAFAIGRHVGFDDETIEDLKLALSEIAADGIEGGGSTIVVTARDRASALELVIEAADARPELAATNVDREQIVQALLPTVRVERRADAIVTTFSLDRA
jgi:anti-sigma regulatory factor (Ser/Thr protein kinase)